MALTAALRLKVDDPTGVAPARRAAETIATSIGWDEQRRGALAIVVTELATNLVRHAGGGEILLRHEAVAGAIDVIASDKGPGIGDLARARRDGFSTASGAGTGLGAVDRLSASFELQSTAGKGTVALARVGSTAIAPLHVDGLVLAMSGEQVSGDCWAQVRDGDELTIALADGLGHGVEAARAATAATQVLRHGVEPVELMELMHMALAPTRGAAAATARLNMRTGALTFAGIGNIAATVVDGQSAKSLASTNGTLGHRVTKIRAYDSVLNPGALLVMHSDGCRNGWDLMRYPGLQRRDPLVIAAVLIRDFERGRDDVSAVVARRAEALA